MHLSFVLSFDIARSQRKRGQPRSLLRSQPQGPGDLLAPCQRTPKTGGAKEWGGPSLTTYEETPPRKQFLTPPHLGTFCPPSHSISLSKSRRNSQSFPLLTLSETAFGGSRKVASDGPSSRSFALRCVPPPPRSLSSAQPYCSILRYYHCDTPYRVMLLRCCFCYIFLSVRNSCIFVLHDLELTKTD